MGFTLLGVDPENFTAARADVFARNLHLTLDAKARLLVAMAARVIVPRPLIRT